MLCHDSREKMWSEGPKAQLNERHSYTVAGQQTFKNSASMPCRKV